MSNYIQYGEFYFSDDTAPEFMHFINEAYKMRCRVIVEYKEGWEDFSGYHGGNGLKHSFYVGRSTGSIKIPLMISRRDSSGGPALLTCSKAIKRWKFKL